MEKMILAEAKNLAKYRSENNCWTTNNYVGCLR